MEGHWREDVVVVDEHARQQLYDAHGYGHPLDGNTIALAPVEAAHLLYRGDLTAVDGADFEAFLKAQSSSFGTRFLAYSDLRSRGFYLSPARDDWFDTPAYVDFLVYPRGKGPGDEEIAFQVQVSGERTPIPAQSMGDTVLAIVDEDGETTYLETTHAKPTGASHATASQTTGILLADRTIIWDPPASLYTDAFFGQPLNGRELTDALQLSLIETAYLAEQNQLSIPGGVDAVMTRGRDVEGHRFNRRLAVYTALRESGTVPKTGFKFGADFRVYETITSIEDIGHSSWLIRVLPEDYEFAPRELALYVRLAGGVRKRMVFALTDGSQIDWLEVSRLTP